MLNVSILSETGDLFALAHEWQELFDSVPDATPFQSPHWVIGWWRHFGDQESWKLWTLVIQQDGVLVGIAPLFIHPDGYGRRQLSFIGAGLTDYTDVLVRPDVRPLATHAIHSHLLYERDDWDACRLRDVPAWSPLIAHAFPAARAAIRQHAVCPVVPLDGSATVARVVARNLRQGHARARALGAKPERVTGSLTAGALEQLFRLHSLRWTSRGAGGSFAFERLRKFHREVVPRLAADGLVSFFQLRRDADLLASAYVLHRSDRWYLYRAAFDPSVARCNPGALLIQYAMKTATHAGAARWDFLRGTEPFKYDWGAQDSQTFCIDRSTRQHAVERTLVAGTA